MTSSEDIRAIRVIVLDTRQYYWLRVVADWMAIGWFPKHRRIQDDPQRSSQTQDGEDPEEDPIDHHGDEFPFFRYLQGMRRGTEQQYSLKRNCVEI